MNWFERYGLVGMFFVIMTAMWFFCLFPDSYVLLNQGNGNVELVKYIAAFFGFGFLPIGYLIVILGQWIYYRQKNIWERIHCRFWKDLSDKIKKEILEEEKNNINEILHEDEQDDEAKIEAVLTYYDRKNFDDIERNKFLSAFATKRYDVIAINRGFILAIPISLICAIFLKLFILNITLKELWGYCINYLLSIPSTPFSAVFVIFVALAVWIILNCSSKILERQIIEIGKRIHINIKK